VGVEWEDMIHQSRGGRMEPIYCIYISCIDFITTPRVGRRRKLRPHDSFFRPNASLFLARAFSSSHSYKFHSDTGRNGRNASYRHLNRYKRTPIPYRVKYRSMPINTGQYWPILVKYRSIPAVAACIIFFHV
jgi:hypothetical protein